jgi:hypothetical protein
VNAYLHNNVTQPVDDASHPLPVTSQPQTSIPNPPNPVPTQIAPSSTWSSGIIPTNGLKSFALSGTLTQAGTLSIQRYVDPLGTTAIGLPITQTLTSNTLGTVAVNDGLPCLAVQFSITNSGGTFATLTNANLLAMQGL